MSPRVRLLIRDAVASTLHLVRSERLAGPGHALTIVTFHRVLPEAERSAYPLPGLAITPERLAWLLGFLRSRFQILPLREVAAFWSREVPAVRPRLAVTFDDALSDNFHHARPILERLGIRATFFVPCAAVGSARLLWHDRLAWALQGVLEARPVDSLECLAPLDLGRTDASPGRGCSPIEAAVQAAKTIPPQERARLVEELESLPEARSIPPWEGMMTWDEIRSLHQQGHEIGSHSVSHPLLRQCDDETLQHEIRGSKQVLEEQIGGEVESFCYPNGDWDERVREVVDSSGYRWAVTTEEGLNTSQADPLALRRCDMVDAHLVRRNGRPSEALAAWRISRLRHRLAAI